jgi:hypothetical protein
MDVLLGHDLQIWQKFQQNRRLLVAQRTKVFGEVKQIRLVFVGTGLLEVGNSDLESSISFSMLI